MKKGHIRSFTIIYCHFWRKHATEISPISFLSQVKQSTYSKDYYSLRWWFSWAGQEAVFHSSGAWQLCSLGERDYKAGASSTQPCAVKQSIRNILNPTLSSIMYVIILASSSRDDRGSLTFSPAEGITPCPLWGRMSGIHSRDGFLCKRPQVFLTSHKRVTGLSDGLAVLLLAYHLEICTFFFSKSSMLGRVSTCLFTVFKYSSARLYWQIMIIIMQK